VNEIGRYVHPLAGLRSRHGTYFVTGNHEYYSGADAWVAYLRHLGINVLLNEHVVIQHGAAQLILSGITDPRAQPVDPGQRSEDEGAGGGAHAVVHRRTFQADRRRRELIE